MRQNKFIQRHISRHAVNCGSDDDKKIDTVAAAIKRWRFSLIFSAWKLTQSRIKETRRYKSGAYRGASCCCCTWCIDRLVDVTASLVRLVVELGALMFAETRRAIRARVHVTDAISFAFAETVATTVCRSASATTANVITSGPNYISLLIHQHRLLSRHALALIIFCKAVHYSAKFRNILTSIGQPKMS